MGKVVKMLLEKDTEDTQCSHCYWKSQSFREKPCYKRHYRCFAEVDLFGMGRNGLAPSSEHGFDEIHAKMLWKSRIPYETWLSAFCE